MPGLRVILSLSVVMGLGLVRPALAAPAADSDPGTPGTEALGEVDDAAAATEPALVDAVPDATASPPIAASDEPAAQEAMVPAPASTAVTLPDSDPPRAAAPADAAAVATPAEIAEPAAEVADRRSGAHLRPRREGELLGKHEVDLGRATYKPGSGLTFTSRDGRFELATRLRAQFLYALDHDNEAETTEHSLSIRRARLQFKGHLFNENNKFKTELALSPRDMGFDGNLAHQTPILDWYLDFTYLRDLTLRVGQYKVPYSRQRVISSGDLQLVDRSIANGEFNLDRDIGVDIRSNDLFGKDKLRYYAGVYFGEGRDQFRPSNFDMFYVARVELLPLGMFDDYQEADFERSLHPRLSFGAAYAFVDGAMGNRGILGSVPTDGGTTDYHNLTADAVFMLGGFSLFADTYYRQGQRNFGSATVVDEAGTEVAAERELARNGAGWSATAGFLIPRVPLELVARYGQVMGLGARTSLSREDEVGGGINYYFAQHPLKLQADCFARYPDGVLPRATHTFRLQLQAAF